MMSIREYAEYAVVLAAGPLHQWGDRSLYYSTIDRVTEMVTARIHSAITAGRMRGRIPHPAVVATSIAWKELALYLGEESPADQGAFWGNHVRARGL